MAYSAAAALTPGVSAQVLAHSFSELSVMLDAGISVDQALEQAGQIGPAHYRSVMTSLANGVM